MLSFLVCLAFIFYHMPTFSRYIEVYFTFPLEWIVFVITFNFGPGRKKIVRYTEDFVT